jgi:hypothetical protein
VWCTVAIAIVVAASNTQGRTLFESVRTPGMDMFGLAAPIPIRMVQALPNGEKCERYKVNTIRVRYFAQQKPGVLM